MGDRGPAKKPTALRELNGNAAARPLNRHEPQYPTASIEPPEWLDEDAQQEWRRLCEIQRRQGILTEGDYGAYTAKCCAWSAFVKTAKEVMNKQNLTETEQGKATPIGEMKKAAELYIRIAKEFGETPASRANIVVSQVTGASKIRELENKVFG